MDRKTRIDALPAYWPSTLHEHRIVQSEKDDLNMYNLYYERTESIYKLVLEE